MEGSVAAVGSTWLQPWLWSWPWLVGLVLVLAVLLSYLHVLSRFLDGIPGPIPLPLLGALQEVGFDPTTVHNFLVTLRSRYGPVSRVTMGVESFVFATGLEAIRELLSRDTYTTYDRGHKEQLVFSEFLGGGIILISNGEIWKRQRKLLKPAFTFDRLQLLATSTAERAELLCAKMGEWADKHGAGASPPFDLEPHFVALTFDMGCMVAYGTDGGAQEATSEGALCDKLEAFNFICEQNMWRYFVPVPYYRWFTTPGESKMRRSLKLLVDEIDSQASTRRAELATPAGVTEAQERFDILTFMLLPEVTGGDKMPQAEIRAQLMTFLFAAHDTTANMLSWMVYYLCTHPEYMREAEDEVARVVQGGTVTPQHVKELRFLGQVAKEALRLRPSAPGRGRTAVKDTTLCGHRIRKGQDIVWSAYALHHDASVWEDPTRFDPHRFDHGKTIKPFSYIPFGAGPRSCLGEHLAYVEAKAVIATVLQRFKLRIAPGQNDDAAMNLTFRPRNGMHVLVERRATRLGHSEAASAPAARSA